MPSGKKELTVGEVLREALSTCYSNRSASHLAAKHPSAALRNAHHALSIDPDWARAHYRCGAALLSLGKCEEAVQSLDLCLELDPSDTLATKKLSLATARKLAAAGGSQEPAVVAAEPAPVLPDESRGALMGTDLRVPVGHKPSPEELEALLTKQAAARAPLYPSASTGHTITDGGRQARAALEALGLEKAATAVDVQQIFESAAAGLGSHAGARGPLADWALPEEVIDVDDGDVDADGSLAEQTKKASGTPVFASGLNENQAHAQALAEAYCASAIEQLGGGEKAAAALRAAGVSEHLCSAARAPRDCVAPRPAALASTQCAKDTGGLQSRLRVEK